MQSPPPRLSSRIGYCQAQR